jgi:hypothetical protein
MGSSSNNLKTNIPPRPLRLINELNCTYQEVEAWMEKCPLKRSAARLPRLGISTPAELELGIEAMKMDVEGDVEKASTPKNSCGSLDFARSIAYLVLPFRQRAVVYLGWLSMGTHCYVATK